MLGYIAKFTKALNDFNALNAKWEKAFPGSMEKYMDFIYSEQDICFAARPLECMVHFERSVKFKVVKKKLTATLIHQSNKIIVWDSNAKEWLV